MRDKDFLSEKVAPAQLSATLHPCSCDPSAWRPPPTQPCGGRVPWATEARELGHTMLPAWGMVSILPTNTQPSGGKCHGKQGGASVLSQKMPFHTRLLSFTPKQKDKTSQRELEQLLAVCWVFLGEQPLCHGGRKEPLSSQRLSPQLAICCILAAPAPSERTSSCPCQGATAASGRAAAGV